MFWMTGSGATRSRCESDVGKRGSVFRMVRPLPGRASNPGLKVLSLVIFSFERFRRGKLNV